MSFLDPFVDNPTTKSNLESFGSQADSRSLDTPSPSNVIQIVEQDEQDEITMTQKQPHNFKRQPDIIFDLCGARKQKKVATRSIDDRFTNSPSPNRLQSLATSTPREEYSAAIRSIDDRFTKTLSPNL
ncbi:hypothetical protein PoB_002735100 [Plakobranchus ocellatus]|uniref:Uncharacterized protein n=1 Tax=Plakobranchus ocellatus TaxID=259542 RepID=A0AAV3ZY65_9GAST|nr:hypothetical protein PoB_002735100 [Plakobranchus ocellatus]